MAALIPLEFSAPVRKVVIDADASVDDVLNKFVNALLERLARELNAELAAAAEETPPSSVAKALALLMMVNNDDPVFKTVVAFALVLDTGSYKRSAAESPILANKVAPDVPAETYAVEMGVMYWLPASADRIVMAAPVVMSVPPNETILPANTLTSAVKVYAPFASVVVHASPSPAVQIPSAFVSAQSRV